MLFLSLRTRCSVSLTMSLLAASCKTSPLAHHSRKLWLHQLGATLNSEYTKTAQNISSWSMLYFCKNPINLICIVQSCHLHQFLILNAHLLSKTFLLWEAELDFILCYGPTSLFQHSTSIAYNYNRNVTTAKYMFLDMLNLLHTLNILKLYSWKWCRALYFFIWV